MKKLAMFGNNSVSVLDSIVNEWLVSNKDYINQSGIKFSYLQSSQSCETYITVIIEYDELRRSSY